MDVIILINCRKGPGVRWSIIRELSPYGAIGANEVLREDDEAAWLRLGFRWSDPAFVGQAAGVLSHIPGIIEIQEEAAPVAVPPPAPAPAKPRPPLGAIAAAAAICTLAGFAYISFPKLSPKEPPPPAQVSAVPAPSLPATEPAPPPPPPTPVQESPHQQPPPVAKAEPVVPPKATPRVFTPAPAPPRPAEPAVISAPPVLQAQAESLPAMNLDQPFPAPAPKRQDTPAPIIAAISAPRPLKRVEPVVNGPLKNSLKGDIIVAVKVYVAANGQVVGTVPMKQPDATANQLAAIAADSIKRWQFQPATQNGKPLAGETIVRLRF